MARSLNSRTAVLAFAVAGVALAGSVARAESKPRVFALVVANNRSGAMSVPDLQYADDDGARYYRLFVGASEPTHVALLTTFDRASRKVYPELASVALPATRSSIEREITRLGDEVRAANERGERTVFYFAYAGHGRVDSGRGYIDLEDQSIDGDFIEHRIIERIPAAKKHVVLDSCNSFFVVNPRKPGGRRWATPEDMALGFSARHPEVGLFLSTNSDNEVFEWSELESGVFSHEVRSGLTGAADVNHDGQVSYLELAAFVDRANVGISRESLRPRLFFRGPLGDASAPLFAVDSLAGRRIELPNAQTRLWLKSTTGERAIDPNKESGPLTVTVPVPVTEELTLFIQREPSEKGAHPTVVEQIVPAGQDTAVVADGRGEAPVVAARGDRLFGNLFTQPFGQLAFSEYVRQAADAPPPVYGVGDAELTRMHNYLSAMAAQGRYERLLGGAMWIGVGTIYGATAIGSLYDHPRNNFAVPGGIAAAASFGIGVLATLTPSTSEDAFAAFQDELKAHRVDQSLVFARTEETLQKVAKRERLTRNVGFWVVESVGVATGALLALSLADRKNSSPEDRLAPSAYAGLFAASGLFIAGGFLLRATDTPTERFLHLYQSDPGLKVQFGASVVPGGGALGLSGTF